MLSLIALLLSPLQSAREIVIREPTPPSRLEVALNAQCGGKAVLVRYAIQRPGPDLFSAVSVDGQEFSAQELGRLNEMLGGYMLDEAAIPSCEGDGRSYEAHMRLIYGSGPRRYHYILGLKNGQFRIIR